MDGESCATCAQSFGKIDDPAIEKPLLPGRYLECCSRSICARCLNSNKRYETYCPYCQISIKPTRLPQGLKDPPAYSSLADLAIPPPPASDSEEPPPYTANGTTATDTKGRPDDILHFLSPGDTVTSLSLAYGTPIQILRKTNNLFSDNLLQGRKVILIPGEFYKGESLSPTPLESEEEEIRKNKIRRWMVSCKVSEYDVALLYLDQSEWDLDDAIGSFKEDEQWEKDHPNMDKAKRKGKAATKPGMRRFVGSSR